MSRGINKPKLGVEKITGLQGRRELEIERIGAFQGFLCEFFDIESRKMRQFRQFRGTVVLHMMSTPFKLSLLMFEFVYVVNNTQPIVVCKILISRCSHGYASIWQITHVCVNIGVLA